VTIANQSGGTIQGTTAGIYNAAGAQITVTSTGSVGIANLDGGVRNFVFEAV